MDDRVMKLGQLIYAENGGEDYDTMVMTGSSLLNRLDANRPKEFGADIDEAMFKGYSAVNRNSPMYQQAFNMSFPDKKSEEAFKRSMQVAYGLLEGTIKRHSAQFFWQKGEAMSLRKKLKSTGKVGKYETYSY
jgi:hypothetical protein